MKLKCCGNFSTGLIDHAWGKVLRVFVQALVMPWHDKLSEHLAVKQ